MEIRTYLGIIGRYWWVIALVVIASMGSAAVLDSMKTPSYNAYARAVVLPTGAINDSRTVVDLIGQMGARYVVNNFAQIFTSAQVKADTLKALNISEAGIDGYTLDANVLPDTSVIEVTASGPDPIFLANYINATITAAINDSHSLFQVVELQSLSPASIPRQPSSPVPTRDIPTGGAVGLVTGILLVLLLDYLRGSAVPATRQNPTFSVPGAAGGMYADWTRSMETMEAVEDGSRTAEELPIPSSDGGWLPTPRPRTAPFATKNRG